MDGPKEDSSGQDPRVSTFEITATTSERRNGTRSRDEKEDALITVNQQRRRKQCRKISSRISKKEVERHRGSDPSHYQQQRRHCYQ